MLFSCFDQQNFFKKLKLKTKTFSPCKFNFATNFVTEVVFWILSPEIMDKMPS